MRITVLTPLFPPDTGAPAPYVKALASHLTQHTVTVIAYGRLPEAVKNVTITPIDKRERKLFLIGKCVRALFKQDTDLLLVNNGPSAELPALVYSYFSQTPMVLIESDPRAVTASTRGWYAHLNRLLKKRCRQIVSLPSEDTYLKPEILPFTELSPTALLKVEDWWKHHLTTLIRV